MIKPYDILNPKQSFFETIETSGRALATVRSTLFFFVGEPVCVAWIKNIPETVRKSF